MTQDRGADTTGGRIDFSHLVVATDAANVARHLERHGKASDEMYRLALGRIDPPLPLPDAMVRALNRALASDQSRRGRPHKNAPNSAAIADALLSIERDDVPKRFLQGLAQRLRRNRAQNYEQISLRLHRRIAKDKKRTLIRGLYRDFYRLLGDADGVVDHPILGARSAPRGGSRHQKALELTHEQLCSLGCYPPSVETLRNLVGKNSYAKT